MRAALLMVGVLAAGCFPKPLEVRDAGGVETPASDAGQGDGGVDAGEDAGVGDAGHDGGFADAGWRWTADDFCEPYATAICGQLLQCGLVSPAVEPLCLETTRQVCQHSPGRGLQNQRRADGGLERCLAAISARGCDTNHFDLPLACWRDSLVAGLLRPGEGCDYTFDCEPGLVCSTEAHPDSCGVCTRRLDAGDGCATTTDCAAPYACVPANDAGTSLVCGSSLPDGAFCTEDSQCAVGRCRQATCSRVAPGSPCASSSPRDCDPDQTCFGSVCRTQPALGEACSDVPCQSGGRCVDGGCQVVRPYAAVVGDACVDPWDCATEVCRDGRCREKVDAGEACRQATDCANGFGCISGQCAPRIAPEEACPGDPYDDLPCRPLHICLASADGGFSCQRLLGVGEACDLSAYRYCAASDCSADGGTPVCRVLARGEPVAPYAGYFCESGWARAGVCAPPCR